MGNIINDIVEDVNIKPNKTKKVLKWVLTGAVALISIAFTFGQFKSSFFNRMDAFETSINNNTATIESMKTEMNNSFDEVNTRIDKGYSDGLDALQDYQEFNKKQLILVLDYGQTNKKLLKEMLEINMQEKAKSVENQINKARTEPLVSNEPQKKSENYINLIHLIEDETKDTIFYLTGAKKEYINNINKNKYEVGEMKENNKNPNLFDVNYRNK